MNVQITNDRTQLVINFYRTNAMDCGLHFLSRESTPERIMRKRIVCARVIKRLSYFRHLCLWRSFHLFCLCEDSVNLFYPRLLACILLMECLRTLLLCRAGTVVSNMVKDHGALVAHYVNHLGLFL